LKGQSMKVAFPAVTKRVIDDIRESFAERHSLEKKLVTDDWILHMCLDDKRDYMQSKIAYLGTERNWAIKSRPFFNIYPAVINSLSNTPVSIVPRTIPKSIVHELGVLCVKLPSGFNHKMTTGITHFFVTIANSVLNPGSRELIPSEAISVNYVCNDMIFHTWCSMDEPFIEPGRETYIGVPMTDLETRQRRFLEKLTLGIMLLAADPEFVQPILLKRDQGKSGDRKKMIERAKRNGVFGFDIGANMDVSPHFRRPHFAIRWTGKGAQTPKLVPVKGTVIHRDAMAVPTGFEPSPKA
jgi:hypothetical protein